MANGLLGDPTALRGLLQSPSTTDFALAMLANSGYSPRRRSLGEIVGASMLQSRQMAAEQAQQKLREEYMRAQIQAMQQKQEPRPEELEIIAGEDGKPIYVPRSQAAGKSPFLQPRGETSQTAALQEYEQAKSQGYAGTFMDYKRDMAEMSRAPVGAAGPAEMPAAVREAQWFFAQTPERQQRYLALKRAQQVENIGGVPTIVGAAGDTTPLSTPDAEAEARRKAAAATAQGTADVEGAGKRGAARGLEYVIQQFRGQMLRTPQGGPMGAVGMIGSVTQSQEARRFNNLREQLSTELRTVFRIPGEGTLSDREQAQYGVQLPDVKNSPDTNEAILQDVQARVAARLGQSAPAAPGATQGAATAPATSPRRRVRVDSNGNVIR
jgi:hypothetical protein